MREFVMADNWYWFLLAVLGCYFIGCFNFAILISHFKNKDIRDIGSGNPGSMNMTRAFGLKVGIINFLCDAIKGGLPALAGYLIFKDCVFYGTQVCVADFARYLYGTAVVIGHIFPVTLKFKGGKGIASTLGLFGFALPCEEWFYIFIVIGVFVCVFIFIALTELGSMGSLACVSALTVWQGVIFILRYSDNLFNGWVISILALLLLINVLTWGAHHKNIFKLLAGEEHKTSVLKHKKKH